MSISFNSHKIFFFNTLAFTICFACWTINGVLVTFLVDNGIFNWDVVQVGWLLGIPILTGSLLRLPLGIWTDKWGGKYVFTGLLFFCAVAMFLLSQINSFTEFVVVSFLFGMVGTSFAVGIAYISIWYPIPKALPWEFSVWGMQYPHSLLYLLLQYLNLYLSMAP
ncbi:MAG: MFS transporter [Chitinophagaceae bacterium]